MTGEDTGAAHEHRRDECGRQKDRQHENPPTFSEHSHFRKVFRSRGPPTTGLSAAQNATLTPHTPTLGAPRDPLYYQSPPRDRAQPSGRAARGVIALSGRSKLLPLVGDALMDTLDVAQHGSPSELLHVVHVV